VPGDPWDFTLNPGSEIEEIALLVKLMAAAAATDQSLSTPQVDELLGVVPDSRDGN
jgi:hypothetical protein